MRCKGGRSGGGAAVEGRVGTPEDGAGRFVDVIGANLNGAWAASAARASGGQEALEPGDLDAGLITAGTIGDDTLQQHGGGRASPDSFTHGSSEDCAAWLRHGYEAGHPSASNTLQTL